MTYYPTREQMEERDSGWYFTGPLTEGMAAAHLDRHVQVERDGSWWHVELCEQYNRSDVAEDGHGPNLEQAWRWALGAFFGPYEEPAAQLTLQMQPQLHVEPFPTPGGVGCEVTIDGLEMRWHVLVHDKTIDGTLAVQLTHSTPYGWSPFVRQPDLSTFGFPPPTTEGELIKWCRWFFQLRQEGRG